MRVLDFLKLTDSEKVKYKQHVYACGWGSDEYIEYDFEVFYGGWPCELCGDGKEDVKTYGASDEFGPKFCEAHFIEISQNTEFVMGGV